MRARYTSWDGTQEVRLDPDEIFEKLAEHLSLTDDLQEAIDRLLREGMSGREFEVVGLDEILDRVRDALDDIYSRFSLDHSLDTPRAALDDLLELEQDALGDLDENDPARRAGDFLARLPHAMDEALDRLRYFEFMDPDAAREYGDLEESAEDIGRVARFVRRYGKLFHGSESLDFADTLELIDKVEALRELENLLFNREFDGVDVERFAELVGEEVVAGIERLREALSMLTDAGYVVSKGGTFTLSPKGARRLGQLALREIYGELLFQSSGRHDTRRSGPGEIDIEFSKAYEFSDPMHIDVVSTLRNAVRRGQGVPVSLSAGDLEVFSSRRNTRTSTVLLLDMSWSMSWEGRFAAAKKVALAMECLMRSRYPRDYFGVVGFYTRAVELELRDLPEVTWNMGDPFTNLQDGLRLGAELLGRHPSGNQQMIIITDGQPTAYFAEGRLFCEWPMSIGGLSTRATAETLKEVDRVTRRGIVLNTFMLDDSPPLRSFVDKVTSINKGRAFYTTPDRLGHFLLVDYVGRRRKVL